MHKEFKSIADSIELYKRSWDMDHKGDVHGIRDWTELCSSVCIFNPLFQKKKFMSSFEASWKLFPIYFIFYLEFYFNFPVLFCDLLQPSYLISFIS